MIQVPKKILIIGGSGFIGSNAVNYFRKKYKVYIIDKNPPALFNQEVPFYNINIRNKKELLSVFFEIDPTWILHLASLSTVEACHNNPEDAYLDNVLGTLNILIASEQIARHSKTSFQKLIVHTSDKVYGEYPEEYLPYLETYPHYRADIYSTSKAGQDMMTLCWASQYNLPFFTVRSGNVFGPGDLNFSRLIPHTIKRILEQKKAVIYQGNESTERDFVYIDDLLNAYKCVFEQGKSGEAYNVGGSGPITVEEIVKLIKKKMHQEHQETEILSNNLPSFKTQYLCTKKLKQLGWNTQISLDKGIENCITFYQGFLWHENS